jgi:hypothetical protein
MVPGGPRAKIGDGVMAHIFESLQRPDYQWIWVWDLFHCIDKAGGRALKADLAQQFADMSKQLEHVFALGQGRHLDQCAATFLGAKFYVCKTHGGTRKIVYLSGVPERFLKKYRTFYLGLLLRMNRALDGRGSHSFKHYTELGEKLTDVSMLVYVMALAPILEQRIVPLANASQDITELPWTRYNLVKDTLAESSGLMSDVRRLRKLQVLVRLWVLLFPYLDRCSMLSWWRANMYSHTFRPVIYLCSKVLPIILYGSFQGCDLMISAPPPRPNQVWAQPMCQCGSRPQLLPGCNFLTRGGGDIRDECYLAESCNESRSSAWSKYGRRIRCPWWVRNSSYSSCKLRTSGKLSGAAEEPLRFQEHILSKGICGQARNPKSCKVPHLIVEALRRFEAGIDGIICTALDLRTELSDYCYGDIGMHKKMQKLQKTIAVAFDLDMITQFEAPSQCHLTAFRDCYALLRPGLSASPHWPESDFEWSPAVKKWPRCADGVSGGQSASDELDLVAMYKLWWSRVHLASTTSHHVKWHKPAKFRVKPFRCSLGHALTMQCLRQHWPKGWQFERLCMYRVAELVQNYAGPLECEDANCTLLGGRHGSFLVDVKDVKSGVARCCQGQVVPLKTPHLRKRLVIIECVQLS